MLKGKYSHGVSCHVYVVVKFGLSEKKNVKKNFLMVLTNQLIYLVNVKTTRKIFSNYVCFSKSLNFTYLYVCLKLKKKKIRFKAKLDSCQADTKKCRKCFLYTCVICLANTYLSFSSNSTFSFSVRICEN